MESLPETAQVQLSVPYPRGNWLHHLLEQWAAKVKLDFQSPIRGAIGCICRTRREPGSSPNALSVPYPRGNWLHRLAVVLWAVLLSAFSPLSAGQLAAS